MRIVILLVVQMATLLASAKTNISHPQYIPWNVSSIEITKVVTDDKTTTLYFRCEGQQGTRITVDSECFLSDEQDRRYRAVSTKGIVLDSVFVYDKKGSGVFSISFEPLPQNTKVFDFVENLHGWNSFRFYMIHDKKSEAALKKRLKSRNSPNYSFPAEAFHADSVVIRGRVTGKRVFDRLSRASLYNLSLRLNNYDYARQYLPTITTVERDGTFEMHTSTMGPAWAHIYYPHYGGFLIPVFLWPGDTIDLDVEHFGESHQKIHYRSHHEECNRLMNLCFAQDMYIRSDAVDNLPEEQMVEICKRQLADYMLLCRYFTDKYQFTPTEQTLLEYDFQMYVWQRLLRNLYEKDNQTGLFDNSYSTDEGRLTEWRQYNMRPVYNFLASMPNTNAMFAVPRCERFLSTLQLSRLFRDCSPFYIPEYQDGRSMGSS